MIRYLLRLMLLLLRVYIRPKRLLPTDTSVVRYRVWPGDADINIHLNNGRVITMMDFGRYDLLLRAGMFKLIKNEKWYPLVGSSMSIYRFSLKLFSLYELHTRLLCWDDKWAYFEQKLVSRGKVAVKSYIKGLFKGPQGVVPMAEVIQKIGIQQESLPIPEEILLWNQISAKEQ